MSLNPFEIKQEFVIDISHWEETIYWDRLSPRPVAVITKATESVWEDRSAVTHSQNMTEHGYLRGLYHFLRENDIAPQVNKFLEVANKCGAIYNGVWQFEFPPILDVEEVPKIQGAKFAYQVKTWLDMVEQKVNVRPLIYTSQKFWGYLCTYVFWKQIPPSWTQDYKYWIAQYPYRPDEMDSPTALPAGVREQDWVGWQYSEAGRMEGIPFDGVDFNQVKTAYIVEISDGDIDLPPVEPDTMTITQTVNISGNVYKLKEQ